MGVKDMTGHQHGMITVLRQAPSMPSGGTRWLCRCDCGKQTISSGKALRRGQYSCGCVAIGKRTHGLSRSATYQSWVDMHRRCSDPTREGYKDYGARGITVCDRWVQFEAFLSDMGEVPKGCTIERVDNDQGYSQENCKWIPTAEQAKNRRNVRHVEIGGEQVSMLEASRRAGVGYTTLLYRINAGWSLERALGEVR